MIRNILFCLVFAGAAFQANAQICTPDTSLKTPGYKPAALDRQQEGVAFEQIISVLSVRDTFRMVGTVKIPVKVDSIKVTGVVGLPAGVSYQCLHPRCIFVWDTVRCIRIYGTVAQAGVYPLKIAALGYAKLGSTPITQGDTIRQFILNVDGTAAWLQPVVPGEWSLYPVPSSDKLFVTGLSSLPRCFSAQGKEVFPSASIRQNVITLGLDNLPSGIYWITDGKTTKKFIRN
ncbi:MAG: T9SS type A sorting domain-containing protein [Bacteroidetes bacterium]|nr:T9SS type A sorting domain-containing protein [Bacteroidota bacterium]